MTHMERAPRPDERAEALAHLGGGLVREGDREDLVRRHAEVARRGARCGYVSTRVLPEPAPASTSSGPSVVSDGVALRGVEGRESRES